MSEAKFFYCKHCGNVVFKAAVGGGELVCCGEPMVELQADTTDAAVEKHVPAVTRDGNTIEVVVGSVEHPMTEEHYIQFIAAVQGAKVQIAQLHPEEAPKATFCVEDSPVTVYEFCNLHGLWKKEA